MVMTAGIYLEILSRNPKNYFNIPYNKMGGGKPFPSIKMTSHKSNTTDVNIQTNARNCPNYGTCFQASKPELKCS